jgi:general stress protein 26
MTARTQDDNLTRLYGLIKNIKYTMLTTVDATGELRSRPMATMEAEPDGRIWFFTPRDAPKVDELRRDHHVNLAYAEPADNKYVSVSGVARLVDDPVKVRELWSASARVFFEGPDDPRLGLLRVTPHEAEYWASGSNWFTQAVRFVVTKITGEGGAMGDNAKLKL